MIRLWAHYIGKSIIQRLKKYQYKWTPFNKYRWNQQLSHSPTCKFTTTNLAHWPKGCNLILFKLHFNINQFSDRLVFNSFIQRMNVWRHDMVWTTLALPCLKCISFQLYGKLSDWAHHILCEEDTMPLVSMKEIWI